MNCQHTTGQFFPLIALERGRWQNAEPWSHQMLYLNFYNTPHRYDFLNLIFKINFFFQKKRRRAHQLRRIPPGLIVWSFNQEHISDPFWNLIINVPTIDNLCHTIKRCKPERGSSLSWKDLCSASPLTQLEIQPEKHPYQVIVFLVNQ